MNILDKFWLQLEKGQVVRRIAFFGMMFLTWETYQWTFAYVDRLGIDAIEAGFLIGAILGPISALQAAVIKFYSESSYQVNPLLINELTELDKKEED